MSADLVELDCEPPGETVIERLEEVLASAREGKISAVAIAIVYRNGSTGDCRSKLPSISTMLGAVTVLQNRLARIITNKD